MEISWTADWAWSLPIIVFTMISHVLLLGIMFRFIVRRHRARQLSGRYSSFRASVSVAGFLLLAIVLHAFEGACWMVAYLLLGALPNARQWMLYSLNAMTSLGHTELGLADPWKLMGALEALNGILLFGLTTAFMFALLVRLNFADEAELP
jgi:hypothetical protein